MKVTLFTSVNHYPVTKNQGFTVTYILLGKVKTFQAELCYSVQISVTKKIHALVVHEFTIEVNFTEFFFFFIKEK